MIAVSLVQLGRDPELHLARLASSLNRRQKYFRFSFDGDITNIGQPLRRDKYYEVEKLLALLAQRSSAERFVIGVTHELVTGADTDSPTSELEYFSLSDFKKHAVVTTAMIKWSSPERSREQYLAYLILCELLIMAAGKNLIHVELRRCIFDDCDERSAFRNAIEAASICPRCLGDLDELSVDSGIIASAQRILKWCKRRPWSITLRTTFSNPLALLVTGIAGGWFAAVYFTQVEWAWILVPSLLILAGVIIFEHVHR